MSVSVIEHAPETIPLDQVQRRLEFVVKISKHCNLRCRYCYEFAELHKTDRMSLDEIERMFRNIAGHAVAQGYRLVHFIWHGGEPLLIKPAYYREIMAIQQRVFAESCRVVNSLQTNLTALSDEWLAFVREGAFVDGLGVSFDPFGTDRVDIRERLRNDQVADNLQKLIDHDIGFGIISVLTRDTVDDAVPVFRMFDQLGTMLRLLPFYMSADAAQEEEYAIDHDRILAAYRDVFDAWLESEQAIPVQPVEEQRITAQYWLSGTREDAFDYESDEFVFIVDTDGGLWGVMNAYAPDLCYGNVFEQPLGRLLASPARVQQAREIGARMERTCAKCPYFGACSGKVMAHATEQEQSMIDVHGCIQQAMIGHILARYAQTGLDGAFAPRIDRVEDSAMLTSPA